MSWQHRIPRQGHVPCPNRIWLIRFHGAGFIYIRWISFPICHQCANADQIPFVQKSCCKCKTMSTIMIFKLFSPVCNRSFIVSIQLVYPVTNNASFSKCWCAHHTPPSKYWFKVSNSIKKESDWETISIKKILKTNIRSMVKTDVHSWKIAEECSNYICWLVILLVLI